MHTAIYTTQRLIFPLYVSASATLHNASKQYLIAKERIFIAFFNERYWQGLEQQDKQALLKGCVKKIVVDGNLVIAIELLLLD